MFMSWKYICYTELALPMMRECCTIMLYVYEMEIHLFYRTCIAYDEGMSYYYVACFLSRICICFTEPALPMMRECCTIMLYVFKSEIHLFYRSCIAYAEGMSYYYVVCF